MPKILETIVSVHETLCSQDYFLLVVEHVSVVKVVEVPEAMKV